MCKYCENDKPLLAIDEVVPVLKESQDTEVNITAWIERSSLSIVTTNGDITQIDKQSIQYCPICGKKL